MYTGLRLAAVAARPLARASALRPCLVNRHPDLRRFDQAALRQVIPGRSWESTIAAPPSEPVAPAAENATENIISEEKDTGHFEVKDNEAILFFDRTDWDKALTRDVDIFPLKIINVLRRNESDSELADLMRRFDSSRLGIMDPIRLVKMAIPEDMPIKVTEILPRFKDGGAFVKFRYSAELDPADIESTLKKRLKENPLKPWFNPFRGIQARLVRGTPWLEDMHRYPSGVLRVEFVPAEVGTTPETLPEEVLYSVFRRYGKIADIIPQSADSKEVPKYANVGFPLLRDAIMARNCAHGFVIPKSQGGGAAGTMLRITYVKRVKGHNIWNWITSHPRIVFPIIAALLAGLSVIIFDPIRQFFIRLHIQHSFNFSESRLYKWFQSHRQSFSLGKRREQWESLGGAIWNHRLDVISQLREWLDVTSDNFIVVTGPRGSGKVEVVMNKALENRRDVLLLDCKPIVEARGESAMIGRLASAVGYRPVFSWANSLSSLIDLAVQGTTGVKAGFSETLESQLTKILYTTASALRDVALSGRSNKERDGNTSEDAWLEAHPERRPVIVIDNFLHKSDEQGIVYDKISEWAASLVQNHAAQVIFLTSENAYSKPLTRALPDRVFRVVSLGDLDHGVAKKYILGRLQNDREAAEERKAKEESGNKPNGTPNLSGLDLAIETLGGRLVDLESLARRIQAGMSPSDATDEIVTESAVDTVKMFLLSKGSDAAEKKWSTAQVWHLVKALAKDSSLLYNQVLLSPTFSSSMSPAAGDGEAALESLAAAELISVRADRGHPRLITAGKPLQQAAFARLVRDRVLVAKMDLAQQNELAKIEAKKIAAAENELVLLGSLPRQTSESAGRVHYLLVQIDTAQRKIEDLDKNMAAFRDGEMAAGGPSFKTRREYR
ncbi:Mitochondrial escape protein 2, putative NTP-binding domain [Cordyceps militaris CM01]|uniref:Mitochondrial escape protein 2 n=1 Tax=Cordyceps militaris (strain CM01) TaxID=983644 RepID=G3JEN1_CORMM|nr:Mitochondrial escape protein 2, putative NTP-binding domain [Cordyceps militaris CM01]EGX93428.1 Mitochondrial escape protein 2, putative NTP-binding domain [Cordyceps militaris CM01]